MCNTVWVLTREINAYEQDGEYFVKVFPAKPSWEDLENLDVEYCVIYAEEIENLLNNVTGGIKTLKSLTIFV